MRKGNLNAKKIAKRLAVILSAVLLAFVIALGFYYKHKEKKEIGSIIKKSMSDDSKKKDIGEEQKRKYKIKKDGDVITQKEYEIDGEKAMLSLSEKDEEININFYGRANTEEKASLMLAILLSSFKGLPVDGYSVVVWCGDLSVSYLTTDNGYLVNGTNKDGSNTLELPDWIVSEFTIPEGEMDLYTNEVLSIVQDFGKYTGRFLEH